MKDSDNLPVACSLTTAELREREATLLARFKSRVIETEELPQGRAYYIPVDASSVRLAAELIVAERECCPFLAFELAAAADMGPVLVRVIGPDGTKEFLRTLLGAR
jgi:hypothetical protein